MVNRLTPAVYQVVYNKNDDRYSIVMTSDKFKLPDILYGNIERNAIRVWNTFATGKISTGILLTGESGSGKSLLGEVICNTAISKGIPVMYLTAVDMTANLLQILGSLTDVVVYMDELGKCANHSTQDKMLSFFSDTNSRRLYIITENSKWSINSYIRNRPGRIRYHIEYKKVPKDIIVDYLNRNVEDIKFREDVFRLYINSSTFSFDHLQALCTEHERYPDDTLDDLVRILNLGILEKPWLVKIESVINAKTNETVPMEKVDYNKRTNYEDEFESYRGLDFRVKLPKTQVSTHPDLLPDKDDPETWWMFNAKASNCIYKDEKFIFKDKNVIVTIIKYKEDILSSELDDIQYHFGPGD